VELFSTATIQRNEKIDYWTYLCCETYANLELEPYDRRSFEGNLCRSVGTPLSFIKVSSSAARITRAEHHIVRTPSHRFHLFVQDQGQGHCSQSGREALLSRGDFMLLDMSLPYRIEFDAFCSAISVGIPETLVNSYLPAPADIVCRTMGVSRGLNRLTSLMVRCLYSQAQEGQLVESGPALARALLDVMSAAYSETYDARVSDSAIGGSRRVQIKAVIEANLTDPKLSPGLIASEIGISRRYLRLLFSREEETICQYVMRRRLEEAARQLAQWMWRGTTITDIAYRWGFNDAAHFSRAFREQLGVSPRQYRQANLAVQSAVADSRPAPPVAALARGE
jgi:AraC-like DNA-binding protein